MDNTNFPNEYSSLVNTNSNYEYLKFLEESGTDLGLESFANARKSKSKSKKGSKRGSSKKGTKRGSSKKGSKRGSSKKGSKRGSKRGSKSKSKKGKRGSKSKSKRKSKRGSKRKSKRRSKSKSKKGKKVTYTKGKGKKGKKYSHKFSRIKIASNVIDLTPKVSPAVFRSITPASELGMSYPSFNYAAPSFSYGLPTSTIPPSSTSTSISTSTSTSTISPPQTTATLPQNNSGYITLPTLANPTTTTNPFSGVITVAQDYIGYRFDPRTNFGVSFNESLADNYVYQGWQKLKNGRYISRPLNSFTEVVLIILEVNFGIPNADGAKSSFNSKTGVYSYTSSLGGITEGIRYDPKSYFGVDFLESKKVASYQPFTLDITGNVQAIEMETVPNSVQVILGIVPETAPVPAPSPAPARAPATYPSIFPATILKVAKRVPTGPIIKLNPALSYRVTDSSSTRFPSSTQIILDSRDPILHTDGPEFVSILPATGPTVGTIINGPFVQSGTTVTAVETNGTIPSDSSIPAQVITISQPLVNVSEKLDDIYTYTFTKELPFSPSPSPSLSSMFSSMFSPVFSPMISPMVSPMVSPMISPAPAPALGPAPPFKPDPTKLYRITDNGYTAGGGFATHFPSSTQIVLDSRSPVFDANGNGGLGPNSVKAVSPKVGAIIKGPFIQPGTTVVKVEETSTMPSNPYVGGTYVTISQPIVGMKEDRGEVFTYEFTQ